MPAEERGGYSIKAAALASGLPVGTLRAWERRYAVLSTRRDESGHRIYSAGDVARLRRLRLAVERGHAIGKIAHADDAEIDRMIAAGEARAGAGDAARALAARIVESAARFDAEACEQAVSMSLALLPLPAVVEEVFAPALREVGERWHSGAFTVGQERLVSGSVRRQTGALLGSYGAAAKQATVVFATLSGELHELGALMHATLGASRRVRACYLGPDMPPAEIAAFANRVQASAVAISLVMTDALPASLAQLASLRAALDPAIEIWIGGGAALRASPSQLPAGTVRMAGAADFEARIALLGGAAG